MEKHLVFSTMLTESSAKKILQQESLILIHRSFSVSGFISNFVASMDDATCVQLFIRDLEHELTHIYLKDEQLMDFFKTVEIRDLEGIKTYIKENGSSVVLNSDDYLENLTTGINFGICLHIPCKSQGFVFAYSLYDTTNELRIFVNHGMEQYHISSNEIEDKKSIVYTDQEMNEITKIAINLISYIYCFPDCLVDGAQRTITILIHQKR